MIAVPPGVRILLAAQPVDFRKGMDGLAALVQQALHANPFQGDVFIFRPRRADRVKILVHDGTGLCLYSKRLEAGRFCWPSPTEGVALERRPAGDPARGLAVAPAAAPSGAATEHGLLSGRAGFVALQPVKQPHVAGAG
jgi:transposase